jgi:hypothetical protein
MWDIQPIGGFFLEKLIDYKLEHFIADFTMALPVLVGVSLGVWGLLRMVNSKLASLGVAGVFFFGAVVLL